MELGQTPPSQLKPLRERQREREGEKGGGGGKDCSDKRVDSKGLWEMGNDGHTVCVFQFLTCFNPPPQSHTNTGA